MKTSYQEYSKKHAKKSHLIYDCIWAFFVGGLICVIGQCIRNFLQTFQISEKNVKTIVPIVLIFLACLFTGLGWFDKLAKKAGAGTLVPITGFANAMCSPAIDSKAEGFVLGVGAKMFTIAGPVIVYGTVASVIYGLIYWLTVIL